MFKIIVLSMIMITGFVALGGHMHGEKPVNFSSFDGAESACGVLSVPSLTKAANLALASLQVLYAYTGWESANYVSMTGHRRLESPYSVRIDFD